MRAAVIVNPAKADVSAPWEQVDKTLPAGWSTPLWLETTPEDPGRGMAEAAVAAGLQGRPGWHGRAGRAFNGVDRRIDLGRVGDQPFSVMAGIGFDAAMMADATEDMKRFRLAGPCGQRTPAPARPSDASAAAHRRRPAAASAGPHRAGGRRRAAAGRAELLPDAAANDGLLDVVVVAPRTLRDWIRVTWRVLRCHRTLDPHLERFRGRSVLLEADRIVPRQMDGEVIDDGRSLNAQIDGDGRLTE
jgi:diacylglycerol kinase family enzyme